MAVRLIGISGKLGTGKSYISNKIITPLIEQNVPGVRVFVIGLGDQVKANVVMKGGHPPGYVEENMKSLMRKEFQKEGMDRRAEEPDYWIKYVRCWIAMFKEKGYTHFIIEGVRFENEIKYIKENGGKVYRIVAQERNRKKLEQEALSDPDIAKELQDHVSEKSVDTYGQFDGLVENDRATAEDLTNYFSNQLFEVGWLEEKRKKEEEAINVIVNEGMKLVTGYVQNLAGKLRWMVASGQLGYRS